MGSISLQPESQSPDASQLQKSREPIRLCGTIPTTVVPAEHYVEQLWAALDQTLRRSKWPGRGVGSDTPVRQGGTLDMTTLTIQGAPAPVREANPDPTGLSPRIVAVHGPTGTGKSTAFPLAITHWTEHAEGLKPGLTVCQDGS